MNLVEKTQKSIAEFKKLTPLLETFAEAVYGKRIPVKIPTKNDPTLDGAPAYSDGDAIYIIPPLYLADEVTHDRAWCGSNNARGVSNCPACARFEDLFASVCHEIAHFTGGSFVGKSMDREQKLAARTISPKFGMAMFMVLEDIRIEDRMFRAQVGTKTMRWGVLTRISDGFNENFPLNSWGFISLIAKSMDYNFLTYPQPVADFISDTDTISLIDRAKMCSDPEQILKLVKPMIDVARKYKLFMDPEEMKNEEEPSNESEDSSENQEEQGQESNSNSSEENSQDDSESGQEDSSNDAEPDDNSDSDGSDVSSESLSGGTGESGSDSEEHSSDETDGVDNEQEGSPDDSDDDDDNQSESESGTGEDSSEGSEDGTSRSSEESKDQDSSYGEKGGEEPDSSSDDGNNAGKQDESASTNSDPGSDDDSNLDSENDATAGLASEASDSPAGTEVPSEPDSSRSGNVTPESGIAEGGDSDLGTGEPSASSRYDIDFNNLGNEQDAIDLIQDIMGHADFEDADRINEKSFREVATAYEAFEGDAGVVSDLVEFKFIPGQGWAVVENGKINNYNTNYKNYANRSWRNYPPEQRNWWDYKGKLEASLSKMRVVFAENDKSKTQANRKSGKINTRALGKRAPIADDRLFKKKFFPKKRDYAVLIMVDGSGSTSGTRLEMELNAVIAQADLLTRMGIRFKVIVHTGTTAKNGSDPRRGVYWNLAFVKIVVKDWNEPWSKDQIERAKNVFSYDCNLDGHAMLMARKEIMTQRVSDRLIMYYSDGAMPLENYEEELKLLKRELKFLKTNGVVVAGVGVSTDSPTKHGLPTVRVDNEEDVPKVVDHLEKLMLEMRGK